MKNVLIEVTADELVMLEQIFDVVTVPGKVVEQFYKLKLKVLEAGGGYPPPSLPLKKEAERP